MAITIISGPTGASSNMVLGYNEIKYILSSTNSTEQSFQYLVQVYEAGTTNSLFEKSYRPRPIDGYGEVEISRELQNHLSYTNVFDNIYYVPGSIVTGLTATGSYLDVDISFGEIYKYEWDFTSFWGITGTPYIQIHGATSHDLQSPGVLNYYDGFLDFNTGNVPYLSGQHTILTLSSWGPNDLAALISFPMPSFGGATSGTLTLTTNATSRFEGLTSRNLLVVNGGMSLKDLKGLTASEYNPIQGSFNSTNSRYLCDAPKLRFYDQSFNVPDLYPQGYTITLYQDLWLHARGGTLTMGSFMVNFSGLHGDYQLTGCTGSNTTYLIPAGPGNDPTTELCKDYYQGAPVYEYISKNQTWDVILFTSSGGKIYSFMQFPICYDYQPDPYQVAFVDRLGSVMTFAFNGNATDKTKIDRKTMNKKLHNTVSYNTYDQSDIVRSVNIEKELELHSIWLTQSDSVYFEQLLTSGYTWIKMKDGLYYACIVKETGFKTQSIKNKKLIRRSITVQLTSKTPVNI